MRSVTERGKRKQELRGTKLRGDGVTGSSPDCKGYQMALGSEGGRTNGRDMLNEGCVCAS